MSDGPALSTETPTGTNIAAFFWIAMIISVGGLAVATALNQPPLLVFAAGMLPLVAYHGRLLFAIRRGLPQGAIDTVYYFGFLVTIATLAATVLKVAVIGDAQLDASALSGLGATFGLGLLATGYALFARIQLMTSVQRFGEEDLGDRVDRYAVEAGKAVATITRSAAEFEVFSRTIRESAQRAVEESAAAAIASIGRIATTNQEHLDSTFGGLTSSVNEVGVALKTAIPADELIAFQKGIKGINGGISALGNQLRRLAERVTASEEAMKDLSASMASSVSPINGACASMERIVSLSEPVAGLRISMASLQREVTTVAAELVKLKGEAADLGGVLGAESAARRGVVDSDLAAVRDHQEVIKTWTSTFGDIAQRMAAASVSAARLGEAIDGLASGTVAKGQLTHQSLERIVAALGQIEKQLPRLTAELIGAQERIERGRMFTPSATGPGDSRAT